MIDMSARPGPHELGQYTDSIRFWSLAPT